MIISAFSLGGLGFGRPRVFCGVVVMTALGGACGTASAYEFRCRFVERVGNTDVVLTDNRLDVTNGRPRDIRIQFGVFSDFESTAPLGGFLGWNVGVVVVRVTSSDNRRSPGRLSPFNFAQHTNSNGNPPLPNGDPFTLLTEIDATLGTQSPIWVCDSQGNAPIRPEPVVRGRNTFVSVFAFSTDPRDGANSYDLFFSGNLIAADSWLAIGAPTPPNCGDPADPSDDVPGSVIYAPMPTSPRQFGCFLLLDIVPTFSSASILGLFAFAAMRRHRGV